MQCPKCYGDMERVKAEAPQIDRCCQCHGLYIHCITRNLLPDMAALLALDTGANPLMPHLDEMVFVECPGCDQIMDLRLQEGPVRIRFELCRSCNSVFLDAGELQLYLQPNQLSEFAALLPLG